MAEIWYLEIDTETLEDKEAVHERALHECIELLELTPEKRESGPETVPELKTGNPLVDESGYVYVLMRVTEDEINDLNDDNWEPGWYKSSVTIVGFENKLRKKPK